MIYIVGQIVENENVHGIEIFNSVDNIYKSLFGDGQVVERYYMVIQMMAQDSII